MRWMWLIILAGVSGKAISADATGSYTAFGYGLNSCDAYASVYEDKTQWPQYYTIWLGGYLTALNAFWYEGQDVIEETDLQAASRWLYNWCTKNPMKNFAAAAEALIAERTSRTATTLQLDQIVLAVQKKLKELGYYRGPLDGIYGPLTQEAMQGWQRKRPHQNLFE